mmetsp:Transcript_79460/g.164987  ORF Transcript_79460/g.164987 Transcript_79460/m.164987 type:complete len:81 (-) Transcript_79460:361-603(-)
MAFGCPESIACSEFEHHSLVFGDLLSSLVWSVDDEAGYVPVSPKQRQRRYSFRRMVAALAMQKEERVLRVAQLAMVCLGK